MTGAPLYYRDEELRTILRATRTVAVVGASTSWNRPSYFVAKYLQAKGFKIYPINPGAAGQVLLGETVLPDLTALPQPVDMVDIFRHSAAAGLISDAAIEIGARTVWMQLGVRNDEAAARAQAAGLRVVMNRCPKIEYGRLFGELGWGGINTGIISSKRRPL